MSKCNVVVLSKEAYRIIERMRDEPYRWRIENYPRVVGESTRSSPKVVNDLELLLDDEKFQEMDDATMDELRRNHLVEATGWQEFEADSPIVKNKIVVISFKISNIGKDANIAMK